MTIWSFENLQTNSKVSNTAEETANENSWIDLIADDTHSQLKAAQTSNLDFKQNIVNRSAETEKYTKPLDFARTKQENLESKYSSFLKPREQFDSKVNSIENTSLVSKINASLELSSTLSTRLEKLGFMNDFRSPDCQLHMSFGSDKYGSKVMATITSPDGFSKRTLIAHENGNFYQKTTGSGGLDLVQILPSGELLELNVALSKTLG